MGLEEAGGRSGVCPKPFQSRQGRGGAERIPHQGVLEAGVWAVEPSLWAEGIWDEEEPH